MNIIVNCTKVNFKGHRVFVDTETDGLYGPVRIVTIYCPTLNADSVYLFDTKDYPLPLAKKRIREADSLVGQNFKYDMDCLNLIPDEWEDTYILDTLLNFRADKHSLDDIARRVYKADVYADMFNGKMDVTIEIKGNKFDVEFGEVEYDKKKMQKKSWAGVVTRQMYAYAALDVWVLPKILESMSIEQAGWNYKLDKATVIAFAQMSQKLPIDVEGLEAHLASNNAKLEEMAMPININSYQQVRPYISGLPKEQAIAEIESGDEALAKMCAEGNDKACKVRAARSLVKQNSFIKKFLNEKSEDDYISGHLNIGTRSGRSKCSSSNLQQVPQVFKKYIKCHDGKFMVYADFAQLELRCLCSLIGEKVLENLFRTGGDIHNYTRDSLFDSSTHVSDAGRGNSLRQIAKIYNFASLYDAGWATIGSVLTKYTGMILTEAELRANKVKWLDGFPGIRGWHNQNTKHWKAKRVLTTPMGRKYIANLPTDANNIMNQGFGAEVAKLAMVNMAKKMDLSKFLMFVHDSWTAEYDTIGEAKEAAVAMSECMLRSWKDISANCRITDLDMPVNCFIGKDWKTIDSDECIAEYELKDGMGKWKKGEEL